MREFFIFLSSALVTLIIGLSILAIAFGGIDNLVIVFALLLMVL